MISHPNVVAIPGASTVAQLERNAEAAELELSAEDSHRLMDAADTFRPLRAAEAVPSLARSAVAGSGTGRSGTRPKKESMDTELIWADATAQADLVRSGELSPSELVESAIDRIERCNLELNAVIHREYDTARAQAAGPLPDGAFRGVPILLKDLGATQAGEPYCEGTGFAKAAGYKAGQDSFVVQAFKRAGFVVLGRTNTPELGTAITTEPVAFGPTRNPWETGHSTGGSSGGSAAAVASGMVPVAHGNDGGGSIRIPANCCGLFGLKPSRGRVTSGPAPTESWFGFSINHVLARSVRDSAAVLDEIAGYHPGDTFVAPRLPGRFADALGADPGRLRVALLDHATTDDYEVDPVCAEAVRLAGRMLESLGHSVEVAHPASLGEAELQQHFLVVVSAAVAAELNRWSTALGRRVAPLGVRSRQRPARRGGPLDGRPGLPGLHLVARGLQAQNRLVLVRARLRPALDTGACPADGAPRLALGHGRGPEQDHRHLAVHRPVQRERTARSLASSPLDAQRGSRWAFSSSPTTGARTC